MPDRYFELNDNVGVEPDYITDPKTGEPVANKAAGELQPAQGWGMNIGVERPTQVGGKIEMVAYGYSVTIEPIPGTRIYKIDDAEVAMAVAGQTGICHEIDPPSQPDLKEARKDTEAARQPPSKKEKE